MSARGISRKIRTIEDVTAYQMCTGCGACAYAAPEALEMVDAVELGRRPVVRAGAAPEALRDALDVCPGVELSHDPQALNDPAVIPELRAGWGPVRAVWEGHASDPDLRFAASSGGIATALALHALEKENSGGVLHTRARRDVPYLNHTVLSHSRAELMAATGSRYAPASPCDGLDQVESAAAPCVFIGKPCDVAAAGKARVQREELDRKLGLTIAMFCAGTPSTGGTLAMLKAMGVPDPADVLELRYRGQGWPGRATVRFRKGSGEEERSFSYQESWGEILQAHRQWRCYVCADHTGEFADVAVGDPWYNPPTDGRDPGRSLVLARTPRGLEAVEAAIAAGYLTLERVDADILPRSQPNLLRTRGSLWGRVLVSRLFGAAAPRYRGMPSFRFWLATLPLRQKLQSTLGTVRRVFRRGLRHPISVVPLRSGDKRHGAISQSAE